MTSKDDLETNEEQPRKGLGYWRISEAIRQNQIFILGEDKQELPIPAPLLQVIKDAVSELMSNRSVEVVSSELLITTQEASDYIGMSRPTFVQLLTDGKIPYTQAGDGKHRRIKISDLVEYQRQEQLKRDAAFANFIRIGQEMMADPDYFEPSAEELRRWIKEARKEIADRERAEGNA
jgi:excisionase family DNA binding protein